MEKSYTFLLYILPISSSLPTLFLFNMKYIRLCYQHHWNDFNIHNSIRFEIYLGEEKISEASLDEKLIQLQEVVHIQEGKAVYSNMSLPEFDYGLILFCN